MEIIWALEALNLSALLDILILTLIFYGVTFVFRGSQALVLLRGMVVLFVVLVLTANVLNLQGLRWLLNSLLTVLIVAVPIVFQQELRRALERLGRGSILGNREAPDSVRVHVINELCTAAERLAERRHGALIVIQRESDLEEFIRTGIALDSVVSSQLLLTIFWPKTELHDGAVIIDQRGRIASAAAVLPLTASRNLPSPKLGTRHRAALGISEVSDALCVIVSEETGRISLTNNGRMVPRLDAERLRTILNAFYGSERNRSETPLSRLRERLQTLTDSVQERLQKLRNRSQARSDA